MTPRGGIDQSEEMIRGVARFPRLFLKAGDRARFHSLANGGPGDPNLLAAIFHSVDTGGPFPRDMVCLDKLTQGEESCQYCESGHDETRRRFALWVYVHSIFHMGDNPDPEGNAWTQVKVANRVMFKEEVKQSLVLWLGVGRKMAWWGQFKAAYNKYGSLEGRLFDLLRVGGDMDTEYHLSIVKEMPLGDIEVSELTPIEDVFRSTLGGVSRPPRLSESTTTEEMAEGEDSTLSEEELPVAAIPTEEEGEELL